MLYKLKWSHKGDGRLRETVWEVKIDCYIVRRRPRDLHATSVADMYLDQITPFLPFLFQKRKFHITALITEHFTALTSRGRKERRKVYCNQNCFCSTGSLHKINLKIAIQNKTIVAITFSAIENVFRVCIAFVSGLHNCLEFSQPLSCLYQAICKHGKHFLLLL